MDINNYSKLIFRTGSSGTGRPATPATGAETTPRKPTLSGLQSRTQQTVSGRATQLSQRRTASQRAQQSQGKLRKRWYENNPEGAIEAREDDSVELMLRNSTEHASSKKDIFLFCKLIKEFWPSKNIKTLLKRTFSEDGKTIKDWSPFYKIFSRSVSGPMLGFYFKPKNITKGKGSWYTMDVSDKGGGDTDDDRVEAADAGYLGQAIHHITSHFNEPNSDEGILEPRRKKILKLLTGSVTRYTTLTMAMNKRKDKEIIKFYKEKCNNKWGPLTPEILPFITMRFGNGCGKYLYRYSKEKNRIYAVKIQGTNMNTHPYAYIDVKNGIKLGDWHDVADRAGMDTHMNAIMKTMSPAEITGELDRYGLRPNEVVPQDQRADYSKGLVNKVMATKTGVEHKNLQGDYYDPLKTKLIEGLKKMKKPSGARKFSDAQCETFANARVADMKKKLDAKIDGNPALKKALSMQTNIKLDLAVDSNDGMSVAFSSAGDKDKYEKMVKPKSAAPVTEASKKKDNEKLAADTMAEVKRRVEKMFPGQMGGLVFTLLQLFGLKKGIIKLLNGESDMVASAALSMLGIRGFDKTLKNAKKIESMADLRLPVGKNKMDVTRLLFFRKAVTLDKIEIVVPKGKIISPGSKMNIWVGGVRKPLKPPKIKFRLGGETNAQKKKRETALYIDEEKVIRKGTKVPAYTRIPKGSIIRKPGTT